MNGYLAQCVDEFAEPTLPDSMTPAEAVTVLKQIRAHHSERRRDNERMIGRSNGDWHNKALHHKERAAHATVLIRRFRTEAQRGNIPPEKWALMNRAQRREAMRGKR